MVLESIRESRVDQLLEADIIFDKVIHEFVTLLYANLRGQLHENMKSFNIGDAENSGFKITQLMIVEYPVVVWEQQTYLRKYSSFSLLLSRNFLSKCAISIR
jgi:hypothetical protein